MKTLFDKIWDSHVVKAIQDGPSILYIDRHYCHEVTTPQAFEGLRQRGLKVFRPNQTTVTVDHNIPTKNQDQPIKDPISRNQVETLYANVKEFGLEIFDMDSKSNGIVHVLGPELGLTQPGMTIVCGDSHTSTHGAFGAIAFGIGTSEVEMVLATQCVLQPKPKTMRITFDGKLNEGISAKDMALYMISQLGMGGATGYFVEYAGEAVKNLSMEQRMTLCNLSIEMGARGGLIAPDEITFDYLKNKPHAPKNNWDEKLTYWKSLPSDDGAIFDKEITFDSAEISPMVTYGTNPGMGIGIQGNIPKMQEIEDSTKNTFSKALQYMGFSEGDKLLGKPIDYVFLGSCTNARIEDFRIFANFVKGKKKSENVTTWLVPGSWHVLDQIKAEKIDEILENAGFELREPGCSACLGMNEDKIPAGKYAVSTSNRNFEGRQGPGARTILAGPLVAAAAAVYGNITDPREELTH